MATIALFHSVLGLRGVELDAARRLRAAGHAVTVPDLYDARTAATIPEGFVLAGQVGWATIVDRARAAVRDLAADTVLLGVSMGGSVAEALLPERPATAGVLLWHGLADIPSSVRASLPVQAHVAEPDAIFPEERIDTWEKSTVAAAAQAALFRYPSAGHFFLDDSLPDHDAEAAEAAWHRSLEFLERLRTQ